jgi:6-phosphogluconolactonase
MRFKLLLAILFFSTITFAQDFYLFVGTYTSGTSKGIYVYHFNAKTGTAEWVSNTDHADNPSFLAVAPDGRHLYAVNEVNQNGSGLVTAYTFDPTKGTLGFLNQQQSGSQDPCHISITKDGKWVVVANYSGGSLASFPIEPNGVLTSFTQQIVHDGSSINTQRQEKAHVHSVFFSPDEKFLLTPDLGMDKVNIYQFDTYLKSPLHNAAQKFISSEPGSGPRHLEFSPNGKFVYIIEELSGTVSVHSYSNGSTKFVQRIATHPADFNGQPGSADIHISQDGRFLYASNRGKENNIAIFRVDQNKGTLSSIGYEPTKGEAPRNFSIDPTGNYLLVANQLTSTIEIFKRDKNSGLLKHTGNSIQIPNPVCLKFLAKK